MPRIPSAADVSPVGAAGSRLPSVRADAQDFGLSSARGLANFGEGLAATRPLAEELLRKEEQQKQAEQTTEVFAHRVAVAEAATQMVDNWEFDGSPAREVARKASKELADFETERLKGQSPERQARAREATTSVHAAHGLRIAQRAQNANVDATILKAEKTLELLQVQAARDPSAAELRAAEGAAVLQSLHDAGALTPEQLAERNEAFRRGLFAAVIRAQPAVHAVADLEAGTYDEALDDPSLKASLLTQARWRLHSEQAQGEAAASGLVDAARRGADEAAHSARTQRLLEAGALADAELAAERARRVRQSLESLRFAPETAVREAVDDLAPMPGAPDADQRLKVQEEARLQVEAMLRERRHDPAAYVMGQPAVAEAFAAAERDPALLGDAVAARLAAQSAMGLPAEERRALTRSESTAIVRGLDALPAAGRVEALAELGRRYGTAGGAAAAALAEAGLSPVETLLIDPAGDPAAWRTVTRLVERQSKDAAPKSPQSDLIAEAADRLIAEGRPAGNAVIGNGGVPLEDVRLSRESLRPKRNPLREDESLEGRLHIPKLTGTPREQAEVLMERLGVPLSPPTDAVAEDVLDVLKRLAVYRHAVRDEGFAASKRFKEKLGEVGVKVYERGLDFAFAQSIWKIAEETTEKAYMHPWSLSDIELTSAIGALAAKLRESADQSVGLAIFSTLAGLFLPAGTVARGAQFALSAIGLADSISTSEADKIIGQFVAEAVHRKILIIDPRVLAGAGLQP